MRRPEQLVEDELIRAVREQGGMVEKIAPIRAGMPDRMVLLNGLIHLVELKAPGGQLRQVQKVFASRAAKRGVHVVVLTGVEQVREWVESVVEFGVEA